MPCKSFINQSCGRTLGVGFAKSTSSTLPLDRFGPGLGAAAFFAAGTAAFLAGRSAGKGGVTGAGTGIDLLGMSGALRAATAMASLVACLEASSDAEYGLAMVARAAAILLCEIYIYMFVLLNDECLLLIVVLLTYYAGCMHMLCACCLSR